MIKNVIFDLSDTLISWQPQKYLLTLTGDAAKVEQLWKIMTETPIWQNKWYDWDRAECTLDEFEQTVMPLFDAADAAVVHHYIHSWHTAYVPIPGIEQLIDDIKACGKKLYILSDFPDIFEEVISPFPFSKKVDHAFASYMVGIRKDNPEVFHRFLERYALRGDECVFIDNYMPNVTNAIIGGLHAELFTDTPSIRAVLRDKYQLNI